MPRKTPSNRATASPAAMPTTARDMRARPTVSDPCAANGPYVATAMRAANGLRAVIANPASKRQRMHCMPMTTMTVRAAAIHWLRHHRHR